MGISKGVLVIYILLFFFEDTLYIQKINTNRDRICIGAYAHILAAPLAIGANISIKERYN